MTPYLYCEDLIQAILQSDRTVDENIVIASSPDGAPPTDTPDGILLYRCKEDGSYHDLVLELTPDEGGLLCSAHSMWGDEVWETVVFHRQWTMDIPKDVAAWFEAATMMTTALGYYGSAYARLTQAEDDLTGAGQ